MPVRKSQAQKVADRTGVYPVTVNTVDVARLVAANGVTFYATFNKTAKTVGVCIGREPREGEEQFVVSAPAARAFAQLILKHTRKGA
jgi:hypothetical protein